MDNKRKPRSNTEPLALPSLPPAATLLHPCPQQHHHHPDLCFLSSCTSRGMFSLNTGPRFASQHTDSSLDSYSEAHRGLRQRHVTAHPSPRASRIKSSPQGSAFISSHSTSIVPCLPIWPACGMLGLLTDTLAARSHSMYLTWLLPWWPPTHTRCSRSDALDSLC